MYCDAKNNEKGEHQVKMRTRLKGVFFDMGGTLVFPDPVRIATVFNAHLHLNITPERCLEAIHAATLFLDKQLEKPSTKPDDWWSQYFTAIVENCASGPMPTEESRLEAFTILRTDHRKRNLWSYFVPEAEELLTWLESEGFLLGIISNSDGRVQAQLREASLLDRFAVVLDSHDVGVEKPDPRIFQMALDASGLSAGEVLYIGDFVHIDGIGASRAGMSVLILDPLAKRSDWGYPTVQSLGDVRAWLESN